MKSKTDKKYKFFTPWKPKGFVMFLGGIEKQHRAVMG